MIYRNGLVVIVVLVCQQPRAGNRGGLKNKSTCNTQDWKVLGDCSFSAVLSISVRSTVSFECGQWK